MMARKVFPILSVFLLLIATGGGYILAGEAPNRQEAPDRPEPSEAPSQAPAEPKEVAPPTSDTQADRVSLNFSGADLVEVIHVLAQHLRFNYTIDPEVRGTVTIFSAEPIKKEDLLPIFHQVLRINNSVAVKRGNLYHIAPIKEGKGLARPVEQGREDRYALQVVPVRFFSVGEMKKLLTPFVTPGGEILDYPRGNFLIIVDLPSNIQRLMEIRDLIDVQVFAGVRMEIYQPKEASAEELSEEMTRIMQAYASSAAQAEGFAAQFLPIPRINQLLVISHSEAAWTYVKRWLERIDTFAEGPGRKIFVYPVENGKATDLADVLNQVLGQTPVSRRGAPRTLQDLHRGAPRGTGTLGAPRSSLPPLYGSTPSGQTQLPGSLAAAPAPARPRRPAAPPPTTPRVPTPPSPGPRAQEQLRIVPDPVTNSLIIFGTAQEFQNIKNILKQIDIIPRQVLMEVLVAEVTLGEDLKFGIEYEILRKGDDFQALQTTTPVQILSGLTGASSGLSSFVGTGGAVRAFLNALMTDSRVKVLSHPSILAVDNQPARIQVGSEEPIATGTTTTQVGTAASSTTIQFRNLGRILTIIPQVNSKGLVHLQVKVEVSERGEQVQVGSDSFFSFDTRDAETTAVVQDGDTLAIGGIITERKSRNRIGIPFLMDVPVLGRFFGTTTDDVDRTELVILITPNVIRSRDEAKDVTEEFMEELSAVKRELERTKEAKEKREFVPQEPFSITPEGESRKAPREGSYNVPSEESRPQAGPVKEIRLTSPANRDLTFTPQEVTEEMTDSDEEMAVEEPEVKVEFQDIWRGLGQILFFGLLGDGEETHLQKDDSAPLVEGGSEAQDPQEFGERDLPAETLKAESIPIERIAMLTGKMGKASPEKGAVVTETIKGEPARKTQEVEEVKARAVNREIIWAIQVKAFSKEGNARSLATRLRDKGYDAYAVRANIKGRTWYRVRVGRLTTREQAKELQETLIKKEKYTKAFITPH